MFNTLAYAKKLKQAGVPEEQAEVMADGLIELASAHLATKEDIAELKTEIANLKVDLIKWMVSLLAGLFIAQVALFWGMLQFTRP